VLASDQCLLFVAAPAFDLPFGRYGIGEALKFLPEYQFQRAARPPVAAERTAFVLGKALLQAAARDPRVVRSVGAKQDANENTHQKQFG
jgi:hypothetical protein